MYGFLCGAYMPIAQFAEPIRNFVVFIPEHMGAVAKQPKKEGVRKTEKTVDRTPLCGKIKVCNKTLPELIIAQKTGLCN